MTTSEEREAILAEARTWLRTPYHHEASVKGHGVDCLYLLIGVWKAVGLANPDRPPHYPPDWALHGASTESYLAGLEGYGTQTERHDPANIVLFKVGRRYSHAGIIVSWPQIIHASSYDKMVCYGNAANDHRLLKQRRGEPRERVIFTFWPEEA